MQKWIKAVLTRCFLKRRHGMYKDLVEKCSASVAAQADPFFQNTFARDDLVNSAIDTVRHFDRDMNILKKDAGILFCSVSAQGGDDLGGKLARIFDKWREDPPSTAALICTAAAHFDIPPDNRNLKAAIMAGLAAEVENGNPYHSNHHFREVTASMARLCSVHNEIAASGGGHVLLDADNIAKCLLAAAAHDLMHDGKTNALTGPGSHQQYRLENKAIAAIEPFMQLAGMSARDQEDVRVMIRITDISAPQNGKSPHGYLKAAVHGATAGLPRDLAALAQDDTLKTMCALMSDADLGPSTATDFSFSRKMTSQLSRENPALADSNKTLAGFLQFVVGGALTSGAGQATSGKALAGIMQAAQTPDSGETPEALPAALPSAVAKRSLGRGAAP